MKRTRVLVIDDDESITTTIQTFLAAKGYDVTVANDGEEALEQVRAGGHAIIVSDIYIDRVTGLDVLDCASGRSDVAVILMTARGSVRTTVEAEIKGAFDYIAKPFDMGALFSVIERAGSHLSEPAPAGGQEEDLEQFGNMVGFSAPMVEVYKKIARCARSGDTVLIAGETGVGKELVARAIHEHSPRAASPFVAVDSGAVPGTLWESEMFGSVKGAFTGADRDRPGIVESARGGTVFFDEVGEIPLDFQAKLLRFLQEKEFRPLGAGVTRTSEVRVIAATNRKLEAMVREGRFREDLFYRLNVLRIDVPPLRERRADIAFLARKFLEEATSRMEKRAWLTPEAGRLLDEYAWPGNVRQLRNTIERLVAWNPPGPLTPAIVSPLLEERRNESEDNPSDDLDDIERRQILKVLEETGGNKTRAAEVLGIQRRTLYKKLARMDRERGGSSE